MKLPTLYKKTSTGAIQFWTISASEQESLVREYQGVVPWGKITTVYGQVGTDSPQETIDYIKQGKNVGKKNETTSYKQAEAEAQAKWEKQKKKGYVESIAAAEADELDDLIEGGIIPMLAHKFSDHGHKIKYPAYVQPKLDGIRCIAILKDGKCTLWSRTRKPITGVPHIAKAIEERFKKDIILDGELYNHLYKNNFEKIVSLVRQEEPGEGHEIVQYHVYDTVSDLPFSGRLEDVTSIRWKDPLFCVQTATVDGEEGITECFRVYTGNGYEGAIVRNADGKYANKRSHDLLKVKEMETDEFKVVGISEGRGKLAGHAIFICVDSKGDEFEAKLKGDTANLKKYFDNHSLWQGKELTVQYQGLTGAKKVPRFPVGIAIRDYE